MLEKLMAYIESENYIYALIAIVISLGYNALKFLDAYHAQRKRRVLDLENTINCKHISPSFKKKIKEEIESEHFKNIYGVKTKKRCIDEMLSVHETMKDRISFRHFIRATRLQKNIFDFANETTKKLKLDLIEKAFGVYHLFFGALFFFSGILMTVFSILTITPLNAPGLASFISSVFFTLTGWVMLYLGAPIYSVHIINLELKKQNKPEISI
ncbi:hypothetical protein [Aeromonas veronii]|uniref:hypothetical protein n=1 Tax=Aeromonas veronii TaxID=654 RepID=UPI00191E167F|nr:hypothetical protein [Aeromonas veronii]MBL0492815.1 hypothetical protein [Aeromonas veronii]